MSRAKSLGTGVETAAVTWMRSNGFRDAERLPLSGALDRGDIRVCADPLVVAECKRGKRGIKLTPWMRELRREIDNAGASLGILVSDPPGLGVRRVGQWFAAVDHSSFIKLCDGRVTLPFSIQDISPVKLNSEYVPLLVAGKADLFARTYTPGNRESQMVCGPLWVFCWLIGEWVASGRGSA